MSAHADTEATGYDKYVNYKTFGIAVGAFVAMLLVPTPRSMREVGVEYAAGRHYVLDLYATKLFGKSYSEAAQWEALTARILEKNMMQGVRSRKAVLRRNLAQTKALGFEVQKLHFDRFRAFLQSVEDKRFTALMVEAHALRHKQLTYDMLNARDKAKANKMAWHIQVCIAMVLFVIVCFVTEAIPLPGVAFCIGLILVFSGIVTRRNVAAMFWSDACWFIMGSLMFAAAFVKTGVDKRLCLLIFRVLARPSVKWITAIMILVISPAAAFISDHALAAMFLPIIIILYRNSVNGDIPVDPELAKMLAITVCMACNIGGFGSPSGGARNVIMMTYLEDMFGTSIGYGQWMIYAMPFVLIMMPLLWLLLNWLFKPKITDLGPALITLKADIGRMGGWNAKQIIAVTIFAVMLVGWITEKNLLLSLTGIRLGIGVIAIAGAVAYLLTGVVNWRDYQEKVDWGVVWLYAGAIIFGKALFSTGAAYWMARSVVNGLASIGLDSPSSLLGVAAVVTAGMTNLIADGPAAASVGPVTLNMAGVSGAGTTLVPFMALITAASSSFAYLLIIGTPPNAIVYSSGFLKPRDYLRVGLPCFVLAFVVLMFLALVYWPLIGYPGHRPM